MWEMVKLLHDRMLKYNWVGFYMLEEKPVDAQPRMLALGPFQGAMTPHTRIPLNQGICGAAAHRQDHRSRRRQSGQPLSRLLHRNQI